MIKCHAESDRFPRFSVCSAQMFSPEMMEQAQRMMANMSPEQMASMAEMASKMDPSMMPKGMPKVSPQQFQEAQEKMKGMSKDEIKSSFKQARSAMSSENSSVLQAVAAIKEQGNALFKSGDYTRAVSKYQEAITELDNTNPVLTTQEPGISILANIAFCHMKLKEWPLCISVASRVISADPSNIKALYRRGVAYRHMNKITLSLRDLRQAAKISPADVPVTTELLEVEAMDPQDEDEEEVEEVTTQPNPVDLLRTNPEMMDGITDMMGNISDDQLEGILKASGLGQGGEAKAMKEMLKNKEVMKSVSEMMKNMDPSQLEAMAKSMGQPGAAPQMPAGDMFNDPKVVKSMESMVDSLPDEVFDDILKRGVGEDTQLPAMVTGSRVRVVVRFMMKLLRLWLFIKTALAAMMSKQGALILAIIVLIVSVIVQFL